MNEWIIYIELILSMFYQKAPFLSILDPFWALFRFDQYQWLIENWIEFLFELNLQSWIIVWIEFWVSNIETNIKLNHFLAKSKHWIESERLSPMAKLGVWSSIVWGKSHQENWEHVIWCSPHVAALAILPNLGAPRKPQGARVRLLSMTLYGGPSPLLTEKVRL